MTIYDDLYSQRAKQKEPITPTRTISKKARWSLVYCLRDANATSMDMRGYDLDILDVHIMKNFGPVYSSYGKLSGDRLANYIFACGEGELLDIIEMFIRIKGPRGYHFDIDWPKLSKFILEFNKLMALHGCVYRIEAGMVVCTDSEVQQMLLIKPALELLAEERFRNADEEFRRALKKHRELDMEGAIREANNAFESTMKIITGKDHLQATDLIKESVKMGAIPKEYEDQGIYLHKLFQALPASRNTKSDSHGQGSVKRVIPEREGTLAINLAATFILYIGKHR